MWGYFSLIGFVIFLIYMFISAIRMQIWKVQWQKITGTKWSSNEFSDTSLMDQALSQLAKSGDTVRFGKARNLAIKLDVGNTIAKYGGKPRVRVRDFNYYTNL